MRTTGRLRDRALAVAAALLLPVLLAGCAATNAYKHGRAAADRNDWDQAVLSYARATTLKPDVNRYQIALWKAKLKASLSHFEKAKKHLAASQLELAIGELQQATYLDPTNQHAQVELEKAMLEWQKLRSRVEKTEMELAKERAKAARGVPKLNPASNIPIILKFKDTETGQIYEAISKASGINFLYDAKLDLKKKTTIDLTNVTFESAMSTLMLINKHFYKVVDENTVLLADDTQQKRREIEDEVIKTFFLSNADVKDVQTLLRTLLDARKIVQNTQLNAITIRDTPNRIAIAEKIIESNDKSKAELIIDVELLEVSRTVTQTLGIDLKPKLYDIKFTGPSELPLNNLGLLRQQGNWAFGPIPSVTLNFLKSDSGTKIIAKPQLRVTEGEKANLHIGDSVPIPTTTFNSAGTIGGSVVPITSFTYQEVGIVIEIEPRVHHNKEVTLKLNVEVSQLGEQVETGQGQSSPAINTRQINTVIRLRDGETNLLAGLIRDEGTEGRVGFPGIINIPGLRNIFTTNSSIKRETDLVLTLTPHIIRIPDIRDEDLASLFIGTEGNPHLRGKASSPFGPDPFSAREGTAEEELAEEEAVDEAAGEPAAGAAGEGAAPAPKPEGAAAKPEAAKPAPAKPTPPPAAPPQPAAQPPAQAPAQPQGQGQPIVQPQGAPQRPPSPSGVPWDDEETTGEVVEEDQGLAEPAPATPPPATPTPPPPPPVTPVTVALAPGRLTVAGGGGFAFNVMVAGASNLQKLSLVIKFDPAIAEFDQGLEGVFMKADGTATSFNAARTEPGSVRLEIQRTTGDKGVTGNGSIAALRFKPVGPGRTLINIISATATDPSGKPIPANPSGADVTVSQ